MYRRYSHFSCFSKNSLLDIDILLCFRFKKEKDEREEQRKEAERKTLAEQVAKADRDAAQRSTISRLQFRLPDGRSRTHLFSADSSLGTGFKLNDR